ncbi:hypothetical protein SRIMM317S_03427 [Streptomyces rimosus subsp. rimosus]
MPARQVVRVSWTVAAGLCSASVTSGRAGRYMSMESGGTAVRPPRIRVTSRLVRRDAAGGAATSRSAIGTLSWVSVVPVPGSVMSVSMDD